MPIPAIWIDFEPKIKLSEAECELREYLRANQGAPDADIAARFNWLDSQAHKNKFSLMKKLRFMQTKERVHYEKANQGNQGGAADAVVPAGGENRRPQRRHKFGAPRAERDAHRKGRAAGRDSAGAQIAIIK
jgi:hypothetical protein